MVWSDSRPTAGYQACERNKQTQKFFQAQHFRIGEIKKKTTRKNISEELERSVGVNRPAKSTRKALAVERERERDHGCFIV